MSAATTSRARGAGREGDSAAVSERRAEILTIAAEIFARKGYVNATVREIADASGILAGSLYHHFDSKEAMVDEILSTFLAELVGDYEAIVAEGQDAETTLRALVHTQFEGLAEHRAAITLANNDSYYLQQIPRFAYLQETGARIADLWGGVLRRGIEEGVFRPDIDPALVWVFIKGAVWATVQYLSDGGGTASRTIADAYLAVLLDGVRAR